MAQLAMWSWRYLFIGEALVRKLELLTATILLLAGLLFPLSALSQSFHFSFTQTALGQVTASLACPCLSRAFSFIVTVNVRQIDVTTVHPDTGLPSVPRVVDLGALPDGVYAITWHESFGVPPNPGEQYSGTFTLRGGQLVDASAPVPTLDVVNVIFIAVAIGLAGLMQLKRRFRMSVR